MIRPDLVGKGSMVKMPLTINNKPPEESAEDRLTNVQGLASSNHQVWATISGADRDDIFRQIDALIRWGVDSIEFRVDLIPKNLWKAVFSISGLSIPWWIAHFGTGTESEPAAIAIRETVKSEAQGAIFHSRCERLNDLINLCKNANKPFAAPYHSQQPLTCEAALKEFEYQESLGPAFRKIAVRANSYAEAAAIVEATQKASSAGGSRVVGAVFGKQRWARIALPHAGSAITFIVAHAVQNEAGGDDQQLHLGDLEHLFAVNDLLGFSVRKASASHA